MSPRTRAAALTVAALVTIAGCSSEDGGDGAADAPRGKPSAGCEGRSSFRFAANAPLSILVGGVERHYFVAVSDAAAGDEPVPLVLLFHGFGSNADRFAELTQLPEQGAERGVVVATPDAGDGQWELAADGADAAFVDAVVEEVTSTFCIDLDHVSVVGMSLGSAFAITYACARQDRIAAIASVTVEFLLGCEKAMSIVAFHGTADAAVPYQDGAVGASLPGPVRGTELNMTDWATLDGCRPEPSVERVGSDVVRRTWSGCAQGTDVVLYSVEGGGHTWPGADPAEQVGHTTDQVDATAESLAFLTRHGLG